MSSGVDVRQRPGLWSYLSGSYNANTSPSSVTRNRRSSSLSLPTRNNQGGPHPRHSRNTHTTSHGKRDYMNNRQRLRHLKAGGVIAFIFLALFFLVPGDRQAVEKYVEDHAPSLRGGDVASDPSVGTDRCKKSYSSHKPIVQYVLMIDAGSTGSRIHVYRFNNCGPTPELEDEVFKMTEPKKGGAGLSAYAPDAEAAARSLDVLMDVAVATVPDKIKPCTPVAVKATAGLRKLGPEMSDKILKAVRHRLETAYPFPLVADDKGGVEVMEGKYEGVYAWITTNYLLGKIGGPDESPTAATFDLGGGSTQIVFEPNYKKAGSGMPKQLAEGDHKYELDFGGRKFSLYQHSYLGFGLMEARDSIHASILETLAKQSGADRSWLQAPVVNPCLSAGKSEEIQVSLTDKHPLRELGAKVKVTMVGPKDGSAVQCQAIAEQSLRKDAQCKLQPCSFNGVHQPSLEKTFAHEDVYLFSYFYDRIKVLGVPESFTLRDLKELAHRVCDGEKAWDAFSGVPDAMDELKGRAQHCLDLNFMFTLLHIGYEMPIDREVKMSKKIKGNELGWCLGASLPLLEQTSGWTCKIKETT